MVIYSVRVPVVVEVLVDVLVQSSDTDEIIDAAMSRISDMSWRELGEYTDGWDAVYDTADSDLQAKVV